MHLGSPSVKALIRFFKAYEPKDWSESAYLSNPDFIILRDSRLLMFLGNPSSTTCLSDLGLKIPPNKSDVFEIPRRFMKAFELFEMYFRRSWQDPRYGVLWAAISSLLIRKETKGHVTLDEIHAKTPYQRVTCTTALESLGYIPKYGQLYCFKMEDLVKRLHAIVKEIHGKSQNDVMDFVCSNPRTFATDVASYMVRRGLGVSATYKLLQRLKGDGYIRVAEHVRVKGRGPMREVIVPNCRKCFYGYSSPEVCFKANFRNMVIIIEHITNRRLKSEDIERMFLELKKLPLCERTIKSLNKLLISFLQFSELLRRREVNVMLSKLEDMIGMKLPM